MQSTVKHTRKETNTGARVDIYSAVIQLVAAGVSPVQQPKGFTTYSLLSNTGTIFCGRGIFF